MGGEASKTTTSTNDNPSSLSGLLADLTPLLGPIQAEQLSQLLTQVQGSLLREQLPHLGGLISTFLGPAALARSSRCWRLLPRLSLSSRSKVRQSRRRPKKTLWRRRKQAITLKLRKRNRKIWMWRKKLTRILRRFQQARVPSIYPTLPMEEQARLWKT